MFGLIPAAVSVALGSVGAAMGIGFLIGVYGHVIKSRPVILAGIVIVGAASAYVAFGLAKLGG